MEWIDVKKDLPVKNDIVDILVINDSDKIKRIRRILNVKFDGFEKLDDTYYFNDTRNGFYYPIEALKDARYANDYAIYWMEIKYPEIEGRIE